MGIKSRLHNWVLTAVKNSNWYTNSVFQDCRKFWEQDTFNLDVVNLGSSSAVCAFDYTGLPVKAANWAMRRNYPLGDKAILENFSSFLRPSGATVLIPICPFSSLSGRYDALDDRYYSFLYPTSIPGFSKAKQSAVMDLRNNPLPQYPAFQIWLTLRKRMWGVLHKSGRRTLPESAFEENANQWIDNWMREFSLDSLDGSLSLVNKFALEETVRYLDAIIAYCKILGHNPVVVFPPMHKVLASRFSEEARKNLIYDMISKLSNKDVRFLNYIDSKEFSTNVMNFKNAYLMSPAGAKKFTARLLKDLGLV